MKFTTSKFKLLLLTALIASVSLSMNVTAETYTATTATGEFIIGDGSGGGGGGFGDGSPSTTPIGGVGGGNSDVLTGASGNDVLFGDGSGGGGGGYPNIAGTYSAIGGVGGSGADIINGGLGNDIIFGDGFGGGRYYTAVDSAGHAGGGGLGGGGGGGGGGTVNGSSPRKTGGDGGDGGLAAGGGGGGGEYQEGFNGNGAAGSAGIGGGSAGQAGGSVNGGGYNINGGDGGTDVTGGTAGTGGDGGIYQSATFYDQYGGGGGGGGAGLGGASGGVGGSDYRNANITSTAGSAGATTVVARTNQTNVDAVRTYLDTTIGLDSILSSFSGGNWAAYGSGADVLNGGAGSDDLFGLGGNDIFSFELNDAGVSDVDVVWDFNYNSESDQLRFTIGGAKLSAAQVDTLIAAQVRGDWNEATSTFTASGTGADTKLIFSDSGSKNLDIIIIGQTSTNSGNVDANASPVITEGASTSVVMDEDASPTAFSLTLNATDEEADTLTWSIDSQASNGTAAVSGTGTSKTITYTPNVNYAGADSFVVQVDDGIAIADTITVNVTVNVQSDAHTGTVTITGLESEGAALNATDSLADIDGLGVFTYQWKSNGGNVGANSATYTLANSDVGNTVTVTISYTDGQGFAESEASAATSVIVADADGDGDPTATDPDDNNPSVFTDTDNDGITNSLDPDDDNDGLSDGDETTYGTNSLNDDTDGDGVNDGAEIANGTDPNNFSPVIAQSSPVTVYMDEDGTPTAWSAPTVTATDSDADGLSWSVKSAPVYGAANVGGNIINNTDTTPAGPTSFTYTPDADFTGTDYFTVQVSDSKDIDTVTIKVVVNPITDGGTSEFIPYTVGGKAVYDHEGSSDPTNGGAAVQPDTIDIASCSPDGYSPGIQPSVMIAYRDDDKNYATTNDASLVMRMRLDANPSEKGKNGSGLQSSHWGFLIDIDNNGTNDYVIDIDGGYASNKLDKVWLYADRNNDFVIDSGEKINEFWAAGSNATTAEKATSVVTITEDSSVTCGKSHDFWLDVVIPVDSFNEAGLAYNSSVPIGAFYSSSASNTNPLQKDWMGMRDGTSDTFIGEGGGRILPATGSISGTVYNDVDGNNVYSEGDPDSYLAQQTVELVDANGNLVASYSASASSYTLNDIDPGNYRIRNVNNGYATITKNVTVVGSENTSLNIPTQVINQMTIYVFEDLDGDGNYDSGEPDINGSDIYLDGADLGANISSNGYISTSLYSDGRHVVKHNSWIAGYITSSSTEIAINHVSGDNHSVYFGLVKQGEVSGVVYVDTDGDTQKDSNESPLPGALISIKNEANALVNSVTTGADGSYRFTGLSANTKYYVEETNPAGYASTSSDQVPVSFGTGSSAVINFGDVTEGEISGFVFSDDNGNGRVDSGEQGLSKVIITIYNNSNGDITVSGTVYASGDIITAVQTDSDGHYGVALPPGRYKVEEQDPLNYVSVTSNTQTVTLPSSQTVANFADMKQGVVTGTVYNDLNGNGQLDPSEPGINSVTLNINGSTPTTSTESDGGFYFGGIADGNYTLNAVVPTGFVATTAASQAITISASSVNADLLFGMKTSGSIAGEVYHDINGNGQRDVGEIGIGGVSINVSGAASASVTTQINGSFSVTGLTASASYTLTETDPTNYRSTTSNSISVSLDANGKANRDASFGDLFEGIVSGVVFDDLDGDGTQDSNERGIVGNTVSLTGHVDSATDSNGNYQFVRVSGDGLSLTSTVLSGYSLTTANNPTTIDMSTYSAPSNFGLQVGGTVLAFVFNDANNNGIQDGEELLMSGVLVSMTSTESATSNAAGYARINDIVPGANTASVAAVGGYADSTASSQGLTINAGQTSTVSFGKYTNMAPWVRPETVSFAENTAVSTSIVTVVSGDDNGDAVTLSITAGNSAGKFSINSNTGEITLVGALDYESTTSFVLTVQAEDGGALTGSDTVTINVTNVNEAPTANPQSVATIEDAPKVITLTGSDPENSSLTYTLMGAPLNGSLSGSAPNLTYVPNGNYGGSDSFTFKVNDGALDSSTVTVSVTVTAINDAPVADSQSVSMMEDAQKPITLAGSDVDSAGLTYSVISAPTNGSLSGSAPNLTYTPSSHFHGSDSFTFKISDGSLDSNIAVVSISITPVNDVPTANPQSIGTVEDTPKAITLTGSDPDADTLSFVVGSGPTHGSLSGSAPNLSYTPNANFNGGDSFTFKVNDGTVDSSSVTVSIVVTAVNDAPVADVQSLSTVEDTAKAITLTGSDPENAILSYTVVSGPASGTLSGSAPNVSYLPDSEYSGSDSFTFKVNDGTMDSSVATVSITVTPANDTPVATDDSATTDEDVFVNIDILANDVDPENALVPSSVVIISQPANGSVSISPASGAVTYNPGSGFHGNDSFQYQVADSANVKSNTATVTITVNEVNDAPDAVNDVVASNEDSAFTFDLLANDSDSDGDALNINSVTFVQNPAHASSFSVDHGVLSFTPEKNYVGNDTLQYTVEDEYGLVSNVATLFITLIGVNDPPVASDDASTTDEDTVVIIDVLANDSDVEDSKPDPATVMIVQQPGKGDLSVDSMTGKVSYTPDPDSYGSDQFTYMVKDTGNSSPLEPPIYSNQATVTITVNSVNDAPVANDDMVTAAEGDQSVVINVLGNDEDVDGSLDVTSVTILTHPSSGSVSLNAQTGLVSYTPDENYNGSDWFTYQVKDDLGVTSNIATVALSVTAVNDPPVADNNSFTVDEDSNVNVVLTASDQESDALTFSVVDQPLNGAIAGILPNLVYTPNADFDGSDSFTFIANDGEFDSELATISIMVNPINDAPQALDDTVETSEDSVVDIDILSNDIDVENELRAASVVITVAPTNGSVLLNPSTGVVSYTPNDDFNGEDIFQYTVSDDGGISTNVATATITVTPENDVPVAVEDVIDTLEDVSFTHDLLANDSDLDGVIDVTSVVVSQAPSNALSYSVSGGVLSYQPAPNFVGNDLLQYTVKDDAGSESNLVTVYITVIGVNDPPVASDDTGTTDEDVALTIDVVANDSDTEDGSPDPTTVMIVQQPAFGRVAVNPLTGVVTYSPFKDANGSDSFTYLVKDTGLISPAESPIYSNLATVFITINPVNDPPVANNDVIAMNEDDGMQTLNILANDYDVDSKLNVNSLSIIEAPVSGVVVVDSVSGLVRYTPGSDFNGSDSFRYQISDVEGLSDDALVSIDINAVDDVPVADDQTVEVNENDSLSIVLSGSDPEGNDVVYQIVNQPTSGILNGSLPDIIYIPEANFNGGDSFTFSVNDGQSDSMLATVFIDVIPVNSEPEALSQFLEIEGNATLSIELTGSDVDGDSLEFVLLSMPGNGQLTGVPPQLTYKPSAEFVGSDIFSFKVNDGELNSQLATIVIQVVEAEGPPVAYDQDLSTKEDEAITVILSGSDPEGASLTYRIITSVSNGVLSGTLPELTYTPTADFNGSDSFSFVVNDGEFDSEPATIIVDVISVKDFPVAEDDEITTRKGTAVTIDVLANDYHTDGDPISLVSTSASRGQVDIVDGRLVYTPLMGFSGTVVIEYLISDGNGGFDTAIVTVTVEADSDAPTIIPPGPVWIDANALYTKVDLGVAQAFDRFGNPLPVSLVDGITFFEPGVNRALWEATDDDGNISVAEQLVYVRPLISFSKDQTVLEGEQVSIGVHLNGLSPVYPLVVPYQVSGTSDDGDHMLEAGSIIINEGAEAHIITQIVNDGLVEDDETLVVSLAGSINKGEKREHVVTIVEGNIAPEITFSVSQNGYVRLTVAQDEGDVLVQSQVYDPNSLDSHSYQWSVTHGEAIDQGFEEQSFTLNPAVMSPGLYVIQLVVADNGLPELADVADVYIEVVPSLAELGSGDSDGDLIPDDVEGYADSDEDGIPDYLDSRNECNVLPEQSSEHDGYMVEGDPGVCLRVGFYAYDGETGGAQVTDKDIEQVDDELVADREAKNIGGIFDFIARGLPDEGQSYQIVLPQREVVPDNAIYRKFASANSWFTFIEDDANAIHSAPGERGFCPPPSGGAWESGLVVGSWCVQLTIEDGGPNDADGLANGTIVDPGGVAVPLSNNRSPVSEDDRVTINQDASVNISVLDNDIDEDGDTLSVIAVSADFGSVVIEDDSSLTYTPNQGFIGEDSITYSVSDGIGGVDTATVFITITATEEEASVVTNNDIVTRGGGGGGAVDGLAILLLMFAGLLKGVCRRTKSIRRAGIVFLALMSSQTALGEESDRQNQAQGADSFRHWYVGFSLAQANSRVTADKLDGRLSDSGLSASTLSLEDKDTAYTFNLGYRFDRSWSIEGGYKDLGEVKVRLRGSYIDVNAFLDAVEHIHPESGKGLFVAGNYHYYWNEDFSTYLKLGVFNWESSYRTSNLGVAAGNDKPSGTDLFYGLGLQYELDAAWAIHADWQRFDFDNDETDVMGLGIIYRWGKREKKILINQQPAQILVTEPEERSDPEPIPEPEVVSEPPVNNDLDDDGVDNSLDQCVETPVGMVVDIAGCPLPERITLHILFDSASSDINGQYHSEIAVVAEKIRTYGDAVRITVEGHTDWKGKQVDNQPLSEARASAVMKKLFQLTGLPQEYFSATGYGELQPVADNNSEKGRFENRRVEILIKRQQ